MPMPIQILPPDEAAKRARERVAEWKRQREIEVRTGAVKRKPEPEGPSRAVGRKKRPRGRAIDREREKLNAELLKEVMESGKTQKVMELLDSGADVNAKGPYSGPVICINRRLRDRKAAVQMLLGPGTVVTPLISALVMGDK
jgi:hypothetical protein